jgi:hypothetical protein
MTFIVNIDAPFSIDFFIERARGRGACNVILSKKNRYQG